MESYPGEHGITHAKGSLFGVCVRLYIETNMGGLVILLLQVFALLRSVAEKDT